MVTPTTTVRFIALYNNGVYDFVPVKKLDSPIIIELSESYECLVPDKVKYHGLSDVNRPIPSLNPDISIGLYGTHAEYSSFPNFLLNISFVFYPPLLNHKPTEEAGKSCPELLQSTDRYFPDYQKKLSYGQFEMQTVIRHHSVYLSAHQYNNQQGRRNVSICN